MILGSFIFFLSIFFAIGMSAWLRSQRTADDYYLASRGSSAMAIGLSAMSSNNSGYMFIGLMGFTYVAGLSTFWLIFGWIVGDLITSFFIFRRFRVISGEQDSLSFSETIALLGGGKVFSLVRLAVAFASLIFLSIFAASQLNAGGKALEALFDFPAIYGALLVAMMVAFYCMSGGIRASLWTDVAQTLVMLLAMGVLAFAAVLAGGGVEASIYALEQADSNYLNLFPYEKLVFADSDFWFLGIPLFIFGWLLSGFCVSGQPHVMVRFMAMRNSNQLTQVRCWYYGFYTMFGLLTLVVGLMTRVHLPDIAAMDPEMVLPTMAENLLPPVMVGLILAGVFAATMSTADSLLLSCSAALTHDILPKRFESNLEMRLMTFGLTIFALSVAWYAQAYGGQNVFTLAHFAWAGMGSAIGPVLLLLCLRQELSQRLALLMMASGISMVVYWRVMELPVIMFNDGFAGIGVAFSVWVIGRSLPPLQAESIQTQTA